MNKDELIAALQAIPGNPEVVIGTELVDSEIMIVPTSVSQHPKFKLTEDTETVEEGLKQVIVIQDQGFDPPYSYITEEEFKEEME